MDGFDVTRTAESTTAYWMDALHAPLLLDRLTRNVAEYGDSVAIEDAESVLTYDQMYLKARLVASALLDAGVQCNDLIGIALPRNRMLPAALVGVWMTGAAYVPLDPDYPADRLAYMIRHSGLRWVVTEADILAAVPVLAKAEVLLLSSLPPSTPERAVFPVIDPAMPAYVIYTSGSTGNPKGVAVSHAQLACLLASMEITPGLSRDDVFLGITTLSFDMSVPELFLPMWVGARLVVLTRNDVTDGARLSLAIDKYAVTTMQGTPTTWRLLLANGWQGAPRLRILIGGEAVPLDLVSILLARSAAVWNMYGPTETTVWSTCERLVEPLERVSIGKPLANTRTYVVNVEGQLLPPGEEGELWIGGASVALGYWREPDLTAKQFMPDPFFPGGRLYRTGDCVRQWEDGRLEFLHRMDAQVKVRGYRIELGEVEAGLLSWPPIRAATAGVSDDHAGNARLVAYLVAEGDLDLHALRRHLAQRLPTYMLPCHYMRLGALPLTPSGKIDRRALPIPPAHVHNDDVRYLAPLTLTERVLQEWWQDLLEQEPVSIDEGFFDLGGHSLLAVSLIQRIQEYFAVDVPLSTLLQHSSIRSLAAFIDRHRAAAPDQPPAELAWRCLVPLRARGTHVPLFCFHPVGGNVLHYQSMVAHLPEYWPVYGLQAVGLDGTSRPSADLVEMATHYLDEIIALQPEGSYWLAGGSFGGVLALEVARQLEAQGKSVACVIMFDTLGPRQAEAAAPRLEQRRYENLLDQAAHSVWTRVRDSSRYLMCRIANTAGQVLPHGLRYWWVEFNNRKALESYFSLPRASEPYKGRVAIMRLPMTCGGVYSLPQIGWEGILAGEVILSVVEGDHAKFIESAGFADALNALMRRLEVS